MSYSRRKTELEAAADDPATIMLFNHECLSDSAGSSMQRWFRLFIHFDPHLGSLYLGWHLIVILFLSLIPRLSL